MGVDNGESDATRVVGRGVVQSKIVGRKVSGEVSEQGRVLCPPWR